MLASHDCKVECVAVAVYVPLKRHTQAVILVIDWTFLPLEGLRPQILSVSTALPFNL